MNVSVLSGRGMLLKGGEIGKVHRQITSTRVGGRNRISGLWPRLNGDQALALLRRIQEVVGTQNTDLPEPL